MLTLQAFLPANQSLDIQAIGRYVEQHLAENWDTVFQNSRDEIVALYDKIGDSAYALYGRRLFAPIHAQFKELGLRSTPKLPFGGFSVSREFGPEDDRQRWFWSKIASGDGTALGTIAVIFYHNHYQIDIPRAPGVIALEETSKWGVVEALSRLSPGFASALEAKEEYAEYMQ